MTAEDVIKVIAAPLITILGAAIAWLIASVLGDRERLAKLEGEVTQQVTVECVREVIKGVLSEAEKRQDALNKESEKRRQLEVREAVREEIARTIPTMVQALRGLSEKT